MKETRKYLLIGFLIGFAFFTIMDRGEKMKPLLFDSILINFMNNTYHIHHWIIFLILLLILLFILSIRIYDYTNCKALLAGICLGSILQGLSYSDAFDIRIK
jgi:hypothetical protein